MVLDYCCPSVDSFNSTDTDLVKEEVPMATREELRKGVENTQEYILFGDDTITVHGDDTMLPSLPLEYSYKRGWCVWCPPGYDDGQPPIRIIEVCPHCGQTIEKQIDLNKG